MARQTLSVDLDTLFPGETFTVGNSSVVIRPLSILQIATISKQLKGMGKVLAKDGITWENYNTQENLIQIAMILLENFSDVLEEASNVNAADLQALPLEVIVDLVNTIMEVNLKSKDTLEKNFKSLIEKFTPGPQEGEGNQPEKNPTEG